MVSCTVHGCRNRSETGARMYGLPANLERRNKWLLRARRSDLVKRKSNINNIKLCEAHFDPSQFCWSKKGRIRLVADAVPTIFTHCHFDKKRREPRLWPATLPASDHATSRVDEARFERNQLSSAVQQVRPTDDAIPTISTHRPVKKKRKETRPAPPPVSAPDIPATSSTDEAHFETGQFSWTNADIALLTADPIPTIFTHRPVDNKRKEARLWPATSPFPAPDIPATSLVDEDVECNTQILKSRLQEEEGDLQQSRDHEVELCQTLRLQVEDLQKRLEEKDNKLIQANKVMRALMDEVQKLRQQLEQQRRKYRDDVIEQRDQQCPCGRGNDTTLGRRVPPNIFLSCTTEDDPEDVPMSPQEVEDDAAGVPTSRRKCLDDTSGREGLLCWGARNDLIPLTGSVPSDCRLSEPESGSSDAGTSHKDNVASHSPPLRSPLGTNIGLGTETRTALSDYHASEPEPGSSDAGTSHKDQDITSQHSPPFSHLETNADIKTEGGEIAISPSCTSEDDPADVPDLPDVPSPGDGSMTSPQEPNLPVPSLRLLDCREMVGPDGIFKVQIVEDPSDEGDHADPLRHQDGDGDRDCKQEKPSFAEPVVGGEQKKQSGDKKLKRKTTQGLKKKMTQGLKKKMTQGLQRKMTQGLQRKTAQDCQYWPNCQFVKPTHKSLNRVDRIITPSSVLQCRECEETFAFPRQLFIHQSMHAKERYTTDATPHENTSTDSPNAGCLNTERFQVDHAYAKPYDENHDADTAHVGESPQLTLLTFTKESLHGNASADYPKTVSPQEVEDVSANATPEPCTLSLLVIQHLHSQSLPKLERPVEKKPLYQCDVCGKILGNKQNLTIHKKRNTDEQPDACKQKRKKILHQCDVCGKILSKKGRLIAHKLMHTGERPYGCQYCDKTFRYRSSLDQHQWQHSTTPEARPCFECDLCGKKFVNKGSLVIHKGLHADTSRFACKYCDKTFALRSLLRSHMSVHTAEKRHVCTQCGAAFTQSGNLRAHMRTHSQERPFKCTVCNKAYRTKAHLKIHSRKHTGERPYSCSHCPRSFPTTGQRRKHEVSHSDEKPYLCLVCGQRCKTRQSLQTHEWLHTGEKPFSCTHCNKAFRFKYLLAEHIRIHTGEKPYQCSDCGERFHTVTRLKVHQVHYHEKVHSCHVCGKAFRSESALKVHQRVHTGEKAYQCSICGERFRYEKPLQTHQKKEHNMDSPKCQQKSQQRVRTGVKRTNTQSVGKNHRTHSHLSDVLQMPGL
ncbi:zinc finger protein 836-like [Engraulis encrasicolus]|uniref:zinc finger protein 836-like n=1 Tax=Engraulis encrasicolus TaxID=184585 RepID=UPI002FCF7D06